MILDSTSLSLQAVLAGAVVSNQPEVSVDYVVWNKDGKLTKPAQTRTALNSTTDVTIVAPPAVQGYVVEPVGIYIYNKDTASVTVTVKTDDGSTERIIIKSTVQTGRSLIWEKTGGWYQSP